MVTPRALPTREELQERARRRRAKPVMPAPALWPPRELQPDWDALLGNGGTAHQQPKGKVR